MISPPFSSKPHIVEPTGGILVWITDPPGMVHQVAPGRAFTDEIAKWLVGPATTTMLAYGAAKRVDRFFFVNDWRGVTSYESAARMRIIAWGTGLARKIARIDIALAPDAPPLFRMAVAGGTMAMSVLGITCAVSSSVEEAIERAGLEPRPG